jgi:hypothetical protein
LKLINNFLFSRKVRLNINGELGDTRQSAEYGLPQGSVLSPVLFKIFLTDFLADFNQRPDIVIYKFADDGTVKIAADNSLACIQGLNFVLERLKIWTEKWRMKVNCNKNKTEIICFNTAEGNRNIIPETFKLGDEIINRVSETTVLGLTIDENLSYQPHSQAVLKSLHHRWATLCKFSNRHWGFSQRVMLHLVKALFLSKLSYGSHIWMTKDNTKEINQLWYHILKSITGAILNINQSIAEVILGVPPILIQTKSNCIKHFLKIINHPVENDRYKEFLGSTYDSEEKSPSRIYQIYKDLFKFLDWKMKMYPSHFNLDDQNIVSTKNYSSFLHLSKQSCSYTKPMMKQYTDTVLWQSALKTQFQMDGYASSPVPSSERIPVPRNTPRKVEVLLMSLFYKNNLLNQALWNIGKVPSPLCSACSEQEETAEHILFECSAVDEVLQVNAIQQYRLANHLKEGDATPDPYIGLLNASKDEPFIASCINIIESINLRESVDL